MNEQVKEHVRRGQPVISVDTKKSERVGEFAVESIRQWWRRFGRRHYPRAKAFLIAADGSGSNANRYRGWRFDLQKLSDETGLSVTVCHHSPGTSKWNKIEHRMFSFIRLNWKVRPLVSCETVVNLIGSTTIRTGLRAKAQLDRREHDSGVQVSDEEMKRLRLTPRGTLPQWNYTIMPRSNLNKTKTSLLDEP